MTDKMSFGFDCFIVEFPKSIRYQVYHDGYCNGVIFYHNEISYDLSHNSVDWNRLVISDNDGGWRDLPFNESTWKLLPEEIEVRKY